jgi:hypothetical protein
MSMLLNFCWRLALLAPALAMAQTPPVPWNGTRDQSCQPYHSAKYKTPIYSAQAINDHLTYVLAVDCCRRPKTEPRIATVPI